MLVPSLTSSKAVVWRSRCQALRSLQALCLASSGTRSSLATAIGMTKMRPKPRLKIIRKEKNPGVTRVQPDETSSCEPGSGLPSTRMSCAQTQLVSGGRILLCRQGLPWRAQGVIRATSRCRSPAAIPTSCARLSPVSRMQVCGLQLQPITRSLARQKLFAECDGFAVGRHDQGFFNAGNFPLLELGR